MPNVLVPLAQGCEELEAVTIMDLLVRAEVEVVSAGLSTDPVTASRGTVLLPQMELDDALTQTYDMVVLPGGLPGADYLGADERLTALLNAMAADGKWVAAICAAPKVLAAQGLLDGKRATAYPGVLTPEAYPTITITNAPVEQDGAVITGRGPGTAMDFSLALIEALQGKAIRDSVETALVR